MLLLIKKALLILIVAVLFISTNSLENSHETYAKEDISHYDENSALALNYYRVRNGGFFESFLNIFSNSKELSTYSLTKKEFEDQIKWLKSKNARFLTEEEVIKYKKEGKFPKRSVWISFDDMDQSIYKNAYPILKKYNIPATGFIITSKVGQKDFHNLNMATLKQLKDMHASGLWTFHSHTNNLHSIKNNVSQVIVTKDDKTLTADIKKSNQYLKKHFNSNTNSIAYPYGQINDNKIKAIKKAGIKYGYTLEEKPIRPNDDDYYIPRILISENTFHQVVQKWKGFKDG